MDDFEKKEELEQCFSETIEDPVKTEEETAAEEVEAEEPVDESAKEVPAVEKTAEKGGFAGIIIGLAVFIAVLAYCWITPMDGSVKDTGVFYAKDNDLYFYDLKHEPYLVQEGIADGGSFHYFYSAWGAGVAENGDWAYYTVNIDEDGVGDLYRKNAKNPSAEAVLIDSDVYDYMASKDGSAVAYLAVKDNSLQLCTFAGDKNRTVVTDYIYLEENVYSLSADGRYLVYKDANGWLNAMEVQNGGHVNVHVLAEACPLYALAEETGILYYVSQTGNTFFIYSYDFKNEPVLVAENAQYMELMPNGKDLLYGVMPTEKIPYSVLLEDDMAESDAKMAETDPDYDQKLMRDEIRAAMENGEGLEPMLMEYYLLSNGRETLVADNVISAVAAKGERSFVTGYRAMDVQPIPLSMLSGGLEMVDMIYYMSLNYGGMEPFLADANGNREALDGSVLLDTVRTSADGSKIAYLAEDAGGGNVLMLAELGKAGEAAAVQENVEEFAFVGRNDLFYYYDYANGAGKLGKVGEGDNSISAASGVHFAEDVGRVYYLLLDQNTGNGKMEWWDGENRETIDGGVFAFQYKGNGKAAILYQYDVTAGVGDLGYYDGKGVTMLDEDITALFMY